MCGLFREGHIQRKHNRDYRKILLSVMSFTDGCAGREFIGQTFNCITGFVCSRVVLHIILNARGQTPLSLKPPPSLILLEEVHPKAL